MRAFFLSLGVVWAEECSEAVVGLPLSGEQLLLPRPASVTFGSLSFGVESGVILAPASLALAARRYSKVLFARPGRGFVVTVTYADETDESYELHVDETGATINATSKWGALRGLATLRQLVFRRGPKRCVVRAPWRVVDRPSFTWRGVMIDTGRRFYPLDFWIRLLDAMEQVKLNVVHWHVSDETAVPLASDSLPNVTLGALGPRAVYKPSEARFIVEAAAERGIRVVPEFDGPAHSASFAFGLPGLFCDDTLDPTNAAVYDSFLRPWLGDARRVFEDDVVHLGGDEVDETCWNSSAAIQSWCVANNVSVDDLFALYVTEAQGVARSVGFKKTMGWDDAFEKGAPPDIVHAWRGQSGSPVTDDPWLVAAATAGVDVVTSHGFYLTAGHGVDDDIVVKWQDIYDRDILGPLDGYGANVTRHVLGAEACVWGTSVDRYTWEAVAWPRLGVLAERLWASSFTPGNYTDIQARLMLLRCRLVATGVAVGPLDDTKQVSKRNYLEQCESLDL